MAELEVTWFFFQLDQYTDSVRMTQNFMLEIGMRHSVISILWEAPFMTECKT